MSDDNVIRPAFGVARTVARPSRPEPEPAQDDLHDLDDQRKLDPMLAG